MLSIDYITNSKDDAIIGLKKRGFKNLDVLDSIIELNNNRKKIQQELDNILFKSNTISKDIAKAFKSSNNDIDIDSLKSCLLYTSPSPRDGLLARMPSSA